MGERMLGAGQALGAVSAGVTVSLWDVPQSLPCFLYRAVIGNQRTAQV